MGRRRPAAQGGLRNCRWSVRAISSTRVRFVKSAKHSALIGPIFPDRRAASDTPVLAGLSPSGRFVLLSSHLTGTSQNDEIIEPIVHRLLSYFMLICEILSWSASALNGLLMKRITPAYLASIILY